MGQQEVDASQHDPNVKPPHGHQPNDEDSDFPEFEFPVSDVGDVDNIVGLLPVSERFAHGESGNARVPTDESPKKMPPAVLRDTADEDEGVVHSTPPERVTARLSSEEAPQPEIRKHVVAEESRIPNPGLASPATPRKVLSSNPSFKSLVTDLSGEPIKMRSASTDRKSNGDPNGESVKGIPNEEAPGSENHGHKSVLSAPSSKRLSGILSRVNAKVAAVAQAADPATMNSPERTRPATASAVSVNARVGKLSADVRINKPREEPARALSPNPSPRNLTSPRRTMADRSRSPTQGPTPSARRTNASPRRGVPGERSVSPVPRSWKDSVYGDGPGKDHRRSHPSKSDPSSSTPSPRFLTPTRAAVLKAAHPPANANPKSLQFTTAFGITTPVKQHPTVTTAPTSTKTIPSVTTTTTTAPTVTAPEEFSFRTDERAERRKDFYSKLGERLKVKEAERKRAEAEALEAAESQLRELRKSLTYKANPVPRFYQEPHPAPAEIRRIAPTRPKSPNFAAPRRRDSCPASTLMCEHFTTGRASPLRNSRSLLRCASMESNSNSLGGSHGKAPKPKQPFRPV